MLEDWRADGLGRTAVEIWVIGRLAAAATVRKFAGGSEAACFFDTTGDVIDDYKANQDDILLIDAQNTVRHWMNVALTSLDLTSNRERLDSWVRDLLL
jgi:hypothetical protein